LIVLEHTQRVASDAMEARSADLDPAVVLVGLADLELIVAAFEVLIVTFDGLDNFISGGRAGLRGFLGGHLRAPAAETPAFMPGRSCAFLCLMLQTWLSGTT
jgi:hypothetical protein